MLPAEYADRCSRGQPEKRLAHWALCCSRRRSSRIYRASHFSGLKTATCQSRARGLGQLPIPSTFRHSLGMLRSGTGDLWYTMFGLVEHVERGPVAIHRIFLDDSRLRKAPIRASRKALGPISGAAVRLAAATEDDPLVIAEGIENATAASLLFGMPAWAALSTACIQTLILPPLPLAQRVVITADYDVNGAGENAAPRAAERWIDEGRRVWIKTPPLPGTDWNDVLLGSRHLVTVEA